MTLWTREAEEEAEEEEEVEEDDEEEEKEEEEEEAKEEEEEENEEEQVEMDRRGLWICICWVSVFYGFNFCIAQVPSSISPILLPYIPQYMFH